MLSTDPTHRARSWKQRRWPVRACRGIGQTFILKMRLRVVSSIPLRQRLKQNNLNLEDAEMRYGIPIPGFLLHHVRWRRHRFGTGVEHEAGQDARLDVIFHASTKFFVARTKPITSTAAVSSMPVIVPLASILAPMAHPNPAYVTE